MYCEKGDTEPFNTEVEYESKLWERHHNDLIKLKSIGCVNKFKPSVIHYSFLENAKTLDQAYELDFSDYDIPRDDPTLIQVIEKLGQDAWGNYAELKIVEIPDDVEWEINDYDGRECIEEKHRKWY